MRGVLITGASGAVGSILLTAAAATGAPARGLSRDEVTGGWRRALASARDEIDGELVVVHAAIPPQPRSPAVMAQYDRLSVELFDQTATLGVGLVLVSTLSIHPGNPSVYVAHKREAEALARRRGGGVVRLGLVQTPGPDSAFTRIRELALRVPLGLLTTPQSVYFVTKATDLSSMAMALAQGSGSLTGVQACADPQPLTLAEAVDVPEGRGRWAAPLGDVLLGSGRWLPSVAESAVDPVINLRAGMGWIDDRA